MLRQFLLIWLMIAVFVSVSSASIHLGSKLGNSKNNNHVGLNPGTPDGREGGEDIATAAIIGSLPFDDTGNTTDNVNDYDSVCPYTGSTAPDVVYSFTPTADEIIQVDLCGSGYDTKTYIFDSAMNVVACNDDAYFDDICGIYVSLIEYAALIGGETYYIIIDGYGPDAGDYLLNVMTFTPPPPCILDCEDDEGEPAIVDGYLDAFNGGCNSPEFGNPFSAFQGDGAGELTHGGQAGWYITAEGGNARDTDWYTAIVGLSGIVEWTLDAEQESYGLLVGPHDCNIGLPEQILVGPCAPQTMTIEGTPGDVLWLWIGSSTFEAPAGFVGNEYKYLSHFTGLMEGTTATENETFGGIKSLFR